MTKLHDLFETGGQSPWLDNLRRDWIEDGTLAGRISAGVRGVTSNPSIFQKAIEGGDAYDAQFADLTASGRSVVDVYWEMVLADIAAAAELLAPLHGSSDGVDGWVSVEVDPSLARDTEGTVEAALAIHDRLGLPNVHVKIPGTVEGLPAIRRSIAAGVSVNVTLLFSLERYDEVIEAYISGLEAAEGPLETITSVASFFVSRVDAAVDAELDAIGSPEAAALRGKVAIANAVLAYDLFRRRFTGERWEALVARGARVQRPLWASTSTKDPSYPPALYVDSLIGPDTVNTLPEATIDAFEEAGTVERTIDADVDAARRVLDDLAAVGVDLATITNRLEVEGVDAFVSSFDSLIESLASRAGSGGG